DRPRCGPKRVWLRPLGQAAPNRAAGTPKDSVRNSTPEEFARASFKAIATDNGMTGLMRNGSRSRHLEGAKTFFGDQLPHPLKEQPLDRLRCLWIEVEAADAMHARLR